MKLSHVLLGIFFLCWLTACQMYHPIQVDVVNQPIRTFESKEDPTIIALIEPYKSQLSAEMEKVIGIASTDLNLERPESVLGNWLGDLLYERCTTYLSIDIDFALMNYGGVRIPALPKGDITKGKIFELMPFDNQLVLVEADGKTVLKLLNKVAMDGGWPISKELQMTIADGKATNIKVKGDDLDLEKNYVFGIPDFIANGGGRCDFLIDKKQHHTNKLVRDAIIEFIVAQTNLKQSLKAGLDGRIKL